MLFQQIPETTESVPVSELRLTISPNFVLAECDGLSSSTLSKEVSLPADLYV